MALHFTLRDASGQVLTTLPGVMALVSPLGDGDPYTWDRPPGSAAWFPKGDGFPSQRPVTILRGARPYHTRTDALNSMTEIAAALPLARALYWGATKVADLDARMPGAYIPQFGATSQQVTHELRLNTLTTITAADLGGVAENPEDGDGTGTGTPQWGNLWT